jgi:hypothetical protein
MKLLNFTTENLQQSKSDYTFEDVQINVNDTEFTIEGTIEIVFDSEEGLTNPDNLDYFIDTMEVEIETIWENNEPIGFSDILLTELKQEIENELNTLTVENH